MLISSWNVNSVRARIDIIKSYLVKYKPDILLMQEIKTEEEFFETIEKFRPQHVWKKENEKWKLKNAVWHKNDA